MRKSLIIVSVAFIVVACSAKTLGLSNEQLTKMQQKVPGITREGASSGSKLYAEKCARCHRLYPPEKYTEAKWNSILPKMFLKAKLPGNDQQKLISNYVIALSK